MSKVLEIKQLRKVYGEDIIALEAIDLEVNKGDFIALLGPNGAGKSTTIGIVSSLVNKTSGKVRINGYDIDIDPVRSKLSVGVVPQEFNFPIFEKVRDILINQAGYFGIPYKEASVRADKYIDLVGLSDKRCAQSSKLSGGMKRRLMIARALMHEPDLLILDEPTAGVDIEVRRFIWEVLQQLNKEGKTIILTTHYLEEAEKLCSRIAIIDRGRIVANGSKRSVLSKLKTQTVIFESDSEIDAKDLPKSKLAAYSVADEGVEATYNKGVTINDMIKELDKAKINITGINNKSNRLEEIFLQLTKKEGQHE
jgi:ABC-2 type transport system ATP-binding protein